MLDAFKLKEFDLEPIYASWADAPVFLGKPKKDLPVGEWLEKIKEGCTERKVPKEYWHKVAQHYMGEKAMKRLVEVKTIMAKVHGGSYRWDWKKFKTAMENMGWDIDASKTESIKLKGKPSGTWWATRKDEPDRPTPIKSESSSWLSRKVEDKPTESPPTLSRASTSSSLLSGSRRVKDPSPERPALVKSESSFWRGLTATKDDKDAAAPVRPPPVPAKDAKSESSGSKMGGPSWTLMKKEDRERPTPVKSKSVSAMPAAALVQKPATKPAPPTRANSIAASAVDDAKAVTTFAQAPVWLLNACGALDFLTTEHPKVMTTLSAILITVGSIPAIPAISAGAGGAVLASGAAHAVGAIAVGVGSWIKAQQDSTPAAPQVVVAGSKDSKQKAIAS